MEHFSEQPFHDGEREMHDLLHVPNSENPTSLYLTPFAANMLQRSPLLALGTLDGEGRPWTSIWGGEKGFARAIGQSVIGIQTTVDTGFDPVFDTLLGGSLGDGEVERPGGKGSMVGGLAIDLEMRRRVKLYGRMIAGAVAATEEGIGEVQLAVRIEQSLGNCPKYLNKKHIRPTIPHPSLVFDGLPLSSDALALLNKADLFFITSSNHNSDMDTNHRGGPPGFVRVLSNDANSCSLVYPEYSGNRLYQTLGNLRTTPLAGLVFPDFDTGDVLYVTGRADILIGREAFAILPRSNLAVNITLSAARFVRNGLSFKGISGELSPYNPPVRLLEKELNTTIRLAGKKHQTAKLVKRQTLSPSISRFSFHIEGANNVTSWKAGQYVALSFEDELDIGYSHMRDDDPTSLNDDFLRTFTISSPHSSSDPLDFDITIRAVGRVTNYLCRLNDRAHLEIPLLGFGGEFFIKQREGQHVQFVAGGVGITPLLAQTNQLDLKRLQLLWAVRSDDLDFVIDTLRRNPALSASARIFVSAQSQINEDRIAVIEAFGAHVERRRLCKEDFEGGPETIYLCASIELRKKLVDWLKGRTLLVEDFGY